MIRLSTLVWLALATAAGIGLFQVKYKVAALEGDLGQINREILRDQEAVHVLAAEWSFLNEPARLSDLAHRYLALTPFTPAQLAHFSDLPDRPAPLPPPDAAQPPAGSVAPGPSIAALTPSDGANDADVAAILASMRAKQ